MTKEQKFDALALFNIACEMKPVYDTQQARYMEFLNEPDSPAKEKAWDDSVKDYHKLLIKNSGRIGKATTLNAAYVRMLMGVRDGLIIWTPESFRQMANFERVNPNYWMHPEAVRKHNFHFPTGISP